MATYSTTIASVLMHVEYDYYPSVPSTYELPSEPACVEIQSICIDGSTIDAMDVIAVWVVEQIQEEILEYFS